MCDSHIPPTPDYARPVTITYSPPALWDPHYDPANPDVGGKPLSLIPDAFKHRTDLLEAPTLIGTATEFQQLLDDRRVEREKNCLRICTQNHSSITDLFVAVLNFTGKTWTGQLMGAVEADVLQVVLYQKKIFNRARPYQIRPDLTPPFTPGHPSYPGGHSAQSSAVATTIALILQSSDNRYWTLIQQCNTLARDIARNRELAGIHYPSDTAAGLALADLYMQAAFASDKFKRELNHARDEWQA